MNDGDVVIKILITEEDKDFFKETIVDNRPNEARKYLAIKTISLLNELRKVKNDDPDYFEDYFNCSRSLKELLVLLNDNLFLVPDFAEWTSYRK